MLIKLSLERVSSFPFFIRHNILPVASSTTLNSSDCLQQFQTQRLHSIPMFENCSTLNQTPWKRWVINVPRLYKWFLFQNLVWFVILISAERENPATSTHMCFSWWFILYAAALLQKVFTPEFCFVFYFLPYCNSCTTYRACISNP